MTVKIISRAAIVHQNKVLLVKNIGNKYWSLPGGHWEHESESLKECASRELLEETGVEGILSDMLFSQEFTSKGKKVLEFIWLGSLRDTAAIITSNTIDHSDTDPDSEIEVVKWFDLSEVEKVEIRPLVLFDFIKNKKVERGHIES